jgi:acetyltransferase
MRIFFEPRSVVLIGVSRQSGPGAYNNLEMMIRYGYKGQIYVVHPNAPEILGIKTYSSVAELPQVPELAIISVGRDRALPVFDECVRKGIRRIIVISQGFSDADEHGKKLQRQMVGIAGEHGARIIGPNTMGVVNAFAGFSTAFVDLPKDPCPPPLTMVVQSGVFQVGFESFTNRMGKAIDVGNCADVDFVDALEFLEHDPQTRIIALHMEGVIRGREFLNVASRINRSKPVIILKTGRSTAGARAALSHTGSLVGEDAVFDAAAAKAGLIRVRNMAALRAVCRAFLEFRSMQGPRLGVVTASGACGIMTADACEDYGLELAHFPESIRAELENPRISWHRLNNPVDVWPLGMVSGSFTDVFKHAVKGLFQDDGVDAVLGIAPALSSPLHKDLDMVAAVRDIGTDNSSHKPLALWIYGDAKDEQKKELNSAPDVACFDSIDEAVMGLAAMWTYERFQKHNAEDELPQLPRPGKGKPTSLPDKGLLVGEDVFALLRHYSIPLVPGRIATDVDSASSIAADLVYPVALKIISPQWLHKSDWGGVRLGISTELELRNTYKELEGLFQTRTPDGIFTGILVQKQISGQELLFGIKRDPQLGPVLVAGMGGIFTEVFKDVARSPVPIGRKSAEAMLRSLRIFPLLQGARGQEAVNLNCLIDVIMNLSELAEDYEQISELDLNPVLANGRGCWCVDSRVVLGR